MAAGNFTLFNSGKLGLMNRDIDWVNATVVGVLLSASYTPDLAHDTYSDISGALSGSADYAPVALSNKAITQAGGTVKWDADDVNYGSAVSISAQYIALVVRAGGALAGTDVLIGYMALETAGAVSSVNSNFIARWNATNGLMTV